MVNVADQFQVKIQWCADRPLVAGRSYELHYKKAIIPMTVTAIKYKQHEATLEHLSARKINAGEIGVINISTQLQITYDEHNTICDIVDSDNKELLGRGSIDFILHRSTNIRWQELTINKRARALAKHQHPLCIWLTGLSGSGKSTIANLLEKRLYEQNFHTYMLDGDNLRHGLNRDLGFTEADRVENIRRVAEVARLMVDAGLIVIASFISPYSTERLMARKLFAEGEFIEVFVDAPLSECEKRDVKGLYAKARRGELKNFTGIDSVYEAPAQPEIHCNTLISSVNESVDTIVAYIAKWLNDQQ
jgi:adenylyl-sulfate kinase